MKEQKEQKETRERLLESARQEFLAKGYQGASLRSICKNAGVTTGALYFFFQDKNDIFVSLVQPVYSMIQELLGAHMRQELLELQDAQEAAETENEMRDDVYASRRIVHVLYQNYDSVQLVLTKSQGSSLERYVDDLVAEVEKHYRKMADMQAQKEGVRAPDDYTIHWVAHMQIDAFVHLLTHEPDEKKAYGHLQDVLKYLVSGWYALFRGEDPDILEEKQQ